LSTAPEAGGSFPDASASKPSRARPPKLCDIEQFSTETQTDADFDLVRCRMLKPATHSSNSPMSEIGDDPMFGTMICRSVTQESIKGYPFRLGKYLLSNLHLNYGQN
jgi:hypothetical protein